jgi:hypothetical protein
VQFLSTGTVAKKRIGCQVQAEGPRSPGRSGPSHHFWSAAVLPVLSEVEGPP